MKTISFNTYLNNELLASEPALSLILSQFTKKISYNKNQVIYAKGKIPLHLSYIETGNAIALSQAKPNRQVLRFWLTNQLICPYGFFTNMPSPQSIIALDDCIVSALNYSNMLTFLTDFPQGYKIINAIIKAEIALVELNIKSLVQNKTPQQHEAFLEALAISFNE